MFNKCNFVTFSQRVQKLFGDPFEDGSRQFSVIKIPDGFSMPNCSNSSNVQPLETDTGSV